MSGHNFASSLKAGQEGEALFAELTGLTRLDGRKHDFVDKDNGDTYELKTDSYDANKTPNFVIERYSDVERKKDGGVWQAANNGTKFWVYIFPKNKRYFMFNTEVLLNTLNKMIKEGVKFRTVDIQNKTWVTQCYLVPRELLKDLYMEVTW